jgi:hypothetical protein
MNDAIKRIGLLRSTDKGRDTPRSGNQTSTAEGGGATWAWPESELPKSPNFPPQQAKTGLDPEIAKSDDEATLCSFVSSVVHVFRINRPH